ncbi:C-type mannose receptor 2-like isoform X3 [Clavelina lepadiformis]|uniref:C-type mannose receptor 2-like isoform X3 n=1 Tax=Clavelina lepadiformis TaxID=159417 RepID=UPI0040435DDB
MKYGRLGLGLSLCFVLSFLHFSESFLIDPYSDNVLTGEWREVYSGSGYYYFLTQKKTFQQARDECKSYGGDLAVRVRDFALRSTLQQTFTFDHAWVGLSKEDNSWVWVDKTSSTSGNTHWIQNPQQPSNTGGNENCGEIIDSYSLRTNDVECSSPKYGLCEHNRQGYDAGNGCRYMLTSKGTWDNTRTECVNVGGDLAAVGMKDFSLRAPIQQALGFDEAWIGLVDLIGGCQDWVWADSTVTSSTRENTDWIENPRQPSNSGGNEKCGEILFQYELRTNDRVCSAETNGLCEIPIITRYS